MAEISLN
jgi:hypothetical protein